VGKDYATAVMVSGSMQVVIGKGHWPTMEEPEAPPCDLVITRDVQYIGTSACIHSFPLPVTWLGLHAERKFISIEHLV
jgi:hypothetical protein